MKLRFTRMLGAFLIAIPLLCSSIPMTAQAQFVPSITSKGAPDVIEAIDEDGNDITDILVVTPYSERDQMQEYKQEDIEEAYENIDTQQIADELNEALQNGEIPLPDGWVTDQIPTLDPDHITITDIFYIHEKDDRGIIHPDVYVTIDPHMSTNQLIMLMYYDGTKWVNVPITINPDGTITFCVHAFGPYMLVTNTVIEQMPDEENGIPGSPQTGESFHLSVIGITRIICAVIFIICIISAVRAYRKKKQNETKE